MFYIKSDDIEELFREAAEKYQIDTTDAEAWDDVRAAVHADDVPPPPPTDGNKKRRWFAFLWLLLIPLGWFAHNAWTEIRSAGKTNTTEQFTKTGVGKDATKAGSANDDVKKTGNNTLTAVATTPNNTEVNKNEKSSLIIADNPGVYKPGGRLMHVKQAEIAGATVNINPVGNQQAPNSALNGGNGPIDNNNSIVAQANKQVILKPNGTAGQPEVIAESKGATPLNLSDTDTNANKPVLNPNPANNNVAADNKKAAPAPTRDSKADNNRYFYVGLSAAPDVSFIHLQKASTLGTGIGAVIGYHLNKNLSIETGALIEKKFYYTNGEYFNISKVPYFVANNIHPQSVTGNCNMIEIPLNLKYTFKATGNNHFYAIGGVSSYLMGHENYTFDYNDWGTPQQSTWGYNNKSNYLFSVLNLGAGYERKLGAKTNLRIEPYFKLPLSGFGTGSLKIASTGLYFTLTRKLF